MKHVKRIGCIVLLLFLLLSPKALVTLAQREFVDARFVRKEIRSAGTIVLYHIVRERPYQGSLTAWLQGQAEAFEKRHKGVYLSIEGMDEATFSERLSYGRRADGYSFFSGSLYADLLKPYDFGAYAYRDGLFGTDRCVPYAFTGFCKLIRSPSDADGAAYYANDILAARLSGGTNEADEEKAQTLYLDLRRAGDLIRYRDGFSLAELRPIDSFTEAVCWFGIDRDADERKAETIAAFVQWLMEPERQQTLSHLGMLPALSFVRDTPPDALLTEVFRTYRSVVTVDPFLWQAAYDTLNADAALARQGDADARRRFENRLRQIAE